MTMTTVVIENQTIEVDLVGPGAEIALAAADRAEVVVGVGVAQAEAHAVTAGGHAAVASLAAASAASSSNLYPSPAAGLAATPEGGFFTTVGNDAATFAILYQEVGGVAVERSRFASASATIDISARNAGVVMDAAIVGVGGGVGGEHATGTDVTAALQALLDVPRGGATIRLIIDGPALVSGLVVKSNTIIEIMEGGALILADNADQPIIRNANPMRGVKGETSDQMFARVIDRNISIICRGRLHGNQYRQVHHTANNTWIVGIAMYGVRRLHIEANMYNIRTFAVHMALVEDVDIPRFHLDAPSDGTGYGDTPEKANQDGLHFNGPARRITIGHVTGRSVDDMIALNADDQFQNMFDAPHDGSAASFGPFVGQGDITDVYVENMNLTKALYFLRILSKDSFVDNIYVNVMRGTSYGRYIAIDPYPELDFRGLGGNVGRVVFNYVDITIIDYIGGLQEIVGKHVNINTKAEEIRFNYIKRNPGLNDAKAHYAMMTLGPLCDIDKFTIGELDVREIAGQDNQEVFLIYGEGKVRRFNIDKVNWLKDSTALRQGGLLAIGFKPTNPVYDTITIRNVVTNRTNNLVVRFDGAKVRQIIQENWTMDDSAANAAALVFTGPVGNPTLIRQSNMGVPIRLKGTAPDEVNAVQNGVFLRADPETVLLNNTGSVFVATRPTPGITGVERLAAGVYKVNFTAKIAFYRVTITGHEVGGKAVVGSMSEISLDFVKITFRDVDNTLVDPPLATVVID